MDLPLNNQASTVNTTEAIDHIRFQLDLLRLTSMPVELTGPSVMQDQENQQQAIRVMQDLQTAAAKVQQP